MMRSCALAALLVAVGALALAGPVAAHESAPAGVVRVAQSLGDRDLTLVLTPPPSGTGSMDVAVEALDTTAAGGRPVRVGVEPAAAAGTPADTAVVPGPVGAPGRSTVALDRAGSWDVVLADGGAVARIPLRWVDPGTPASTWVARLAIAVAVLAGIAATTAGARRRPRLVGGLAALAAAGVAAGVTAIALGTPAAPAAYVAGGATTGPAAAPMAGMDGMAGMGGTAAMPATGAGPVTLSASLRPSVLALGFTDGSTGADVDDLTVHDEAFVHVAVLGQDGSEQHLHPVRVAPGRWEVRFTPTAAGRYGLFAEFSRDGADHQLARTVLDVPGTPPAPAALPGPGVRDVAGMQVAVSVDGVAPGGPTRIRAEFSAGGRPVTDLQAWLGMAGHLFVLGPGRRGAPDPADAATSFTHAHDMTPRAAGRGHGPEITFTTVLPEPGRYRLWLQVLRGGSLVTVPVELDVPGGPTGV
ncbi:hypothetical protein [Actinomycetospora atypica]|uniref:Secreted protein n=1 Tax=Actinomycetospora atypica TaxID=1290095 RepID=A0ABV9YNF9_9PSEU